MKKIYNIINNRIYNKINISKFICNILLVILVAVIVTGITGCNNNKNADMADNTTGVQSSQPADDSTKEVTDVVNESETDTQDSKESDDYSINEAENETPDESEQTDDNSDKSSWDDTTVIGDATDTGNTDTSMSDENSDRNSWSDGEDNNMEDSDEADNDNSEDVVDNRIIICIDPGHGGSNEGTKETYDGSLIKEKDITMTIARKLKYYLEQNDNIRVVMTRNSDTAVSLAGRIEYAAANNADYVISMHINSKSTDEIDAHGCMVLMSCSRYQPANARFTSIYDRERSLAYSILAKLNGIGIPIANDSWNGNEYKDGILQRVNTINELYPDGSVADYYGLINDGTNAGIPTIIVEHAFLSNVSDYRNCLSTDAQLDALARADAAGILEVVLQ